jgi:hypothetical protein
LNREVRSLAKIGSWEVDLVNESVFWSDEVHQLHDTDVKSFIPALEGAMNFIGRFSPTGKDNIAACISTGQQCDFEAVLITTKNKEVWVPLVMLNL